MAYYKEWIDCVIESSALLNNNQKKVEEKCKEKAGLKATSSKKEDMIVPCDDHSVIYYK